MAFVYGAAGDRPIVGDWDGDGTDTPGVVRVDATGGSQVFWLLRNDQQTAAADIVFAHGRDADAPLPWAPDPCLGLPPDVVDSVFADLDGHPPAADDLTSGLG